MKYEFHPEALSEYEDAARYYADRQLGLDLRFIICVEEAIRQIVDAPEQFRIFDHDVRRCLTHVFPYAILFTLEPNYILIIAIMHCQRKPGYWRQRIE